MTTPDVGEGVEQLEFSLSTSIIEVQQLWWEFSLFLIKPIWAMLPRNFSPHHLLKQNKHIGL